MIEFREWVVKRGGAVEVARILNVTPRAVYLWMGGSRPKTNTILVIHKKSKISLAALIKWNRGHNA